MFKTYLQAIENILRAEKANKCLPEFCINGLIAKEQNIIWIFIYKILNRLNIYYEVDIPAIFYMKL